MNSQQRRFIFVVGTTASGKSEWALKLAQKYDGVIINCDSVQTYKKVEIGAAKPTFEERSLVPHYLLDYVSPPQELTAGQYARDFQLCLENIPAEKPVFVVGGTGFYFMAIEKGMYPVISVSEELKKQVEDQAKTEAGAQALWQELQAADPDYAAKLHASDLYRIGRAIELIRTQGRSVTAIQKEFEATRKEFSDPLLKLAPVWDRDVLKERIFLRTQAMIQKGLISEVKALLDEGLEDWAPLSSVGYKEVVRALKSEKIDLNKLVEEISQSTRQLAKRQRTWFQRDPQINWVPGAAGFSQASDLVENFLKP